MVGSRGRSSNCRRVRVALALVLGAGAGHAGHRRGHAGGIVSDQPQLGGRDAAQEQLGQARERGSMRTGMIVLADKGLAGRDTQRCAIEQIHVLLVRLDRKDEPRRFANLAGVRQWIESVSGTLKGQLDFETHGGRTLAAVFARVAQRPACPGRRDLAQLAHQHTGQTLADRLPPLINTESRV